MTAAAPSVQPAFDPQAIDGIDFFVRTFYGERATAEEKTERHLVVERLLQCHFELVELVSAELPSMLINEACGDILGAVSRMLYISRDEAQRKLLGLSELERNRRIWQYVDQARP